MELVDIYGDDDTQIVATQVIVFVIKASIPQLEQKQVQSTSVDVDDNATKGLFIQNLEWVPIN
jgi:hypothetical protein